MGEKALPATRFTKGRAWIYGIGLQPWLAGSLLLSGCQYIPGTDAQKIAEAKERVAYLLLDPDAAKFRAMNLTREAICGQVNGKNKLGAYTGFVFFLVKGEDVSINDSDTNTQFDECKSAEELMLDRLLSRSEAESTTSNTAEPAPVPTEATLARGDGQNWSAEEKRLIDTWERLNSECRGGPGDSEATTRACEERDNADLARRLAAADLCHGKENEAGYQMVFHRCAAGSNRFSEDRTPAG